MRNSHYQVNFGVEIEFVFVFHEKLILAELLNSVEGLPGKPGGILREGREHVNQLTRAIQKVFPDESHLAMNQAPYQYSETRPRYHAWGVWLDWDEADPMIKTNGRSGSFLLRTYGREPCQVAKEVLRSGPQAQALEYWNLDYPDEITVDVHPGSGKPSDFSNWHLIPECAVEAHTRRGLRAYLELYKRCSDRDGSESPRTKRRLEERVLSDGRWPAKRFKSTPVGSASPTRKWVNVSTPSGGYVSPNHDASTSSFQTNGSNQENEAPSPSSRIAPPAQLPDISFGSNASPNPPANLPPSPTSQRLTTPFQIYISSSADGSSQIHISSSEDGSSAEPNSSQAHQPETCATGGGSRTPERPSFSPLTTVMDTVMDTVKEENEGALSLGEQGLMQRHPNLLQMNIFQSNQEHRKRVQQSLLARNPLMQLPLQHVPPSQLPAPGIFDSVEVSDHEPQSSIRPGQPPVRPSAHAPSSQLREPSRPPNPRFNTHTRSSPGPILHASPILGSDATEDDPKFPPPTNSQKSQSEEPDNRYHLKSLSPDPPGLKVNQWDSYGMELVSRVLHPSRDAYDEITILCNRLKGHNCSLHGATSSPKTGLHVHLKTEDGDIDLLTLQHLLYILAMYERHINTLHVPHRRPNSDSDTVLNELSPNTDNFKLDNIEPRPGQPPLTVKEARLNDMTLQDIRRTIFAKGMDLEGLIALAGGEKTQLVNFTLLSTDALDEDEKPHTLEFRQHESVLRGDMIKYWVTFCVGLLRLANHMAWGNVPEGRSAEGFRGNRREEGYWVTEWNDSMSVWDLFEEMELEEDVVRYFMRRAAFFEGYYGEGTGLRDGAGEGEWGDYDGFGLRWVIYE